MKCLGCTKETRKGNYCAECTAERERLRKSVVDIRKRYQASGQALKAAVDKIPDARVRGEVTDRLKEAAWYVNKLAFSSGDALSNEMKQAQGETASAFRQLGLGEDLVKLKYDYLFNSFWNSRTQCLAVNPAPDAIPRAAKSKQGNVTLVCKERLVYRNLYRQITYAEAVYEAGKHQLMLYCGKKASNGQKVWFMGKGAAIAQSYKLYNYHASKYEGTVYLDAPSDLGSQKLATYDLVTIEKVD